MSELREWLRRNNFEQYADAFEANDIGIDILPELSELDLEQLGVSLGNRRRLLKAIAEGGVNEAQAKAAEAEPKTRRRTRRRPRKRRRTPSAVRSRCCSAIWSDPRRYRAPSIRNCWEV